MWLLADGDSGCWVAMAAAFSLIGVLVMAVAKMAMDVGSLKSAERKREDAELRRQPKLWDGEP